MGLISIGLVGMSSELEASCKDALKDWASVRRIDVGEAAGVDVVIISIAGVVSSGVTRLARCRQVRPDATVLLLAQDVDVDLGVELVKCGATDLVSVALLGEGLRPKIERALGQRIGPALDLPSLRALVPSPRKGTAARNLRASRRVACPAGARAVVLGTIAGRDVTFDVVDLSIPTGGWPGGMLLRGSADDAFLIGKLQMDPETPRFSLILGGDEPPIPIAVRPVLPRRKQAGRDLLVAVQFVPDPMDLARLQAFWAKSRADQ